MGTMEQTLMWRMERGRGMDGREGEVEKFRFTSSATGAMPRRGKKKEEEEEKNYNEAEKANKN